MKKFLELIQKRTAGGTEMPPAVRSNTPRPESRESITAVAQIRNVCCDPAPVAAGTFRPPSRAALAVLRKPAEDYPLAERALRDEKVLFVREVYEHARREKIPEWRSAAEIAAADAGRFPLLAEAGKKGASALSYTNYRNWLTGTTLKPGLGRMADGSPDYGNADILLRNYGCERGLYGDPAFWESFKAHALQNGEAKIAKIYRLLALKWRLEYPDTAIPALHQVRTYIKARWPKRFLAYMRRGETYYLQHYRDFVERDPESIRPNEAWVADSQDCDFMIRVSDGMGGWKAIRPKICVIMDIKSQHLVSIQLVPGAVNNEVIRNAFALAVSRYGRPRIFLTDNGADYCKAGFTVPVTFTPSVAKTKIYSHSIMLSLDIIHLRAETYNARAKFVERFFREMAEYSREARGYVGNKPEKRPASANVWMKNAEYLMNESEACNFLGTMIDLYHRKKCPDSKFLRGLSPDQAFADELRFKRAELTYAEYLRAFQMPDADAHVVDGRGPSVRYNGRRFTVTGDDRVKLWPYDGKVVMLKTDLLNDEHVFVYDLDGTYLAEARTPDMMPYFARVTNPEEESRLAARLEEIRAEKKYLDTMAMDETGGWHKLDGWTLYQLPREAFLGPAKLKLLDTMHSVKGETHNPRIFVLPDELRHGDIAGEKTVLQRNTINQTDAAEAKEDKADKPEKRDVKFLQLAVDLLSGEKMEANTKLELNDSETKNTRRIENEPKLELPD